MCFVPSCPIGSLSGLRGRVMIGIKDLLNEEGKESVSSGGAVVCHTDGLTLTRA